MCVGANRSNFSFGVRNYKDTHNMNIFVVDEDPIVAATMLCDKHNIKMILESAQMLCSALPSARNYQMYNGVTLYKPAFMKHPCTLWAGKSHQNYQWLLRHAVGLYCEYTQRYGKIHKSEHVIKVMAQLEARCPLPDIGLTPFAQAMPEQYRCEDAVTAYRKYYIGEKKRFAKWAKTPVPSWFASEAV